MRQHDVRAVRAAKLGSEEMGYVVSKRLLDEAEPALRPGLLIVEKEEGLRELLPSRAHTTIWSPNPASTAHSSRTTEVKTSHARIPA